MKSSKSFYTVFLDFNYKIMLRSRVMARFAYLECGYCQCSLFRTVRSKLVHVVATLLS